MEKIPRSLAVLETMFAAIDPETPCDALSERELTIMVAYDAALNLAEIEAEEEASAATLPDDLGEFATLYEGAYIEREQAIVEAFHHTAATFDHDNAFATEQQEAGVVRFVRRQSLGAQLRPWCFAGFIWRGETTDAQTDQP